MRVDRILFFALVSVQLVLSCGPTKKGLFGDKRSAHQKYGDKIREAGLDKTEMGSLWFIAADKSLTEPIVVTVPYKEKGYFAADRPSSAGYAFDVRKGERLVISIDVAPVTIQNIFAELWQPSSPPQDAELLSSIDSTLRLEYDIENDGRYIVRVQPELLNSVEYTITINTSPSLAFPVDESGKPKMISFWNDPRDGGARSHEGVDISASFRTPAIASADGRVNRVMENRLGGKAVFLRPHGRNYSLYYAHLDTQTVSTGDEVKTGQVVGLIGNTGNARTTAPHLHFGIYTRGGAVDPFPFINHVRKEPEEIKASAEYLNQWLRTTKESQISATFSGKSDTTFEVKRGAALLVCGIAGNKFRVQLPGGQRGYISNESATDKMLRTISTDTITRLLDQPLTTAPAKKELESNTDVSVIGTYGEYLLVKHGEELGWIK